MESVYRADDGDQKDTNNYNPTFLIDEKDDSWDSFVNEELTIPTKQKVNDFNHFSSKIKFRKKRVHHFLVPIEMFMIQMTLLSFLPIKIVIVTPT